MRRIFLSLFFACCVVHSQGQFSMSAGGIMNMEAEGVDALFIFNGIVAGSTVSYVGPDFKEWQRKEDDGTYLFYANTIEMSPNEGGYKVKRFTGEDLFIWVFDYANYVVSILDMKALWLDDDKCTNLLIQPQFGDLNKKMLYQTKDGQSKELQRIFTLTYQNVKWNGSAWDKSQEIALNQKYPFTSLSVQSPFCNTSFVLSGDDFARRFGIEKQFKIDSFRAIAIEAHPKGEIAKREGENELDQTSTSQSSKPSRNCKCKEIAMSLAKSENITIGGSAPLVVDFESNANEDAVVFHEWYIYDQSSPSKKIRYTDKDFRYTFKDAGQYTVKLFASSAECQYTDSINVSVLESFLDVPNVFSPNGDGVNDEFRVVFRSIIDFKGFVFNRWGRLVFKWTDPAKGWDGKINGKMAAPGAYYYVIQAKGSDKDKKGNAVEWKCSGDINLLRGKK